MKDLTPIDPDGVVWVIHAHAPASPIIEELMRGALAQWKAARDLDRIADDFDAAIDQWAQTCARPARFGWGASMSCNVGGNPAL